MEENKTLYQLLYELCDKKFIFSTANYGNWGDEMIRLGSLEMFNDLKIDIINEFNFKKSIMVVEKEGNLIEKEIRVICMKIDKDTIIYINGAGGLGCKYKEPILFISLLKKVYPNNLIILGPSGVATDEETKKYLLERFNFDKNFIFFARELTTYNFMKENFKFKVYIDECPSFYLEKKYKKLANKIDPRIILILRDDSEKVDTPEWLNDYKFDRSLDIADKAKSYDEWCNFHNDCDTIITNRCHSAILGNILGKQVIFFNNNYHKNKSIYEYSLKKRGVKWK